MQIWTIIRKDVIHQFRSGFGLVIMFVAPLLVTGLIYAAFSSILSAGNTPQITQIRVQVANLDQGAYGAQFLNALQNDSLQSVLQVSAAADNASARAALANKQVDIAVIIPADFSQHLDTATLTVVHDAASTIAPRVVATILSQALDTAVGVQIAVKTATESLATQGLALDTNAAQHLAGQYVAQQQTSQGLYTLTELAKQNTQSQPSMIATISVSMMIFFMFFTGTQIAQSLIAEEEQGTLARLFTTSVRLPAVLIGKMGAACLTLIVQAVVLLGVAAVLFGLRWGDPLAIALLLVPLILACASFGMLVISFIKNARQAGTVVGGVLTLSGMLGGLFTGGLPNAPAFIDVSSLVLPQGWAMRGWRAIIAGGTAADVVLPAFVLLLIAGICFVVANTMLRRRFA